jgi:hypothetical protein
MIETIDKAIEVLCQKIVTDKDPRMTHSQETEMSPDAALKYTQAAESLANTKRVLGLVND